MIELIKRIFQGRQDEDIIEKKPKSEFNCIYDANDEKAMNSHLDQIFEKHHG